MAAGDPDVKDLDLEVLRHGEEGIELLLGNVNLALVHELEQDLEVLVVSPLQYDDQLAI